jgi:hypothetical protein
MKFVIIILACVLFSYSLFAAYQLGNQNGFREGAGLGPAIAAGERVQLVRELKSLYGSRFGEKMQQADFIRHMEQRRAASHSEIARALPALTDRQKKALFHALWDDLTEEEMRALGESCHP